MAKILDRIPPGGPRRLPADLIGAGLPRFPSPIIDYDGHTVDGVPAAPAATAGAALTAPAV